MASFFFVFFLNTTPFRHKASQGALKGKVATAQLSASQLSKDIKSPGVTSEPALIRDRFQTGTEIRDTYELFGE